jgi:hypothetical protein
MTQLANLPVTTTTIKLGAQTKKYNIKLNNIRSLQ